MQLLEYELFGLDLGQRTGMASFKCRNIGEGQSKVLSSLECKLPSDMHRYNVYQELLRDSISSTGAPVVVFYEKVHKHLGTDAAHCYGAYEAILHMHIEKLDRPAKLVGLGVKTIKKFIAKNGNASKEDVKRHVIGLISKMGGNPREDLTDNESDAIAVLLTGMTQWPWQTVLE